MVVVVVANDPAEIDEWKLVNLQRLGNDGEAQGACMAAEWIYYWEKCQAYILLTKLSPELNFSRSSTTFVDIKHLTCYHKKGKELNMND